MVSLEAITGFVGVCALAVAWDANIQSKKSRVKEFEMFYTERYWDLIDRVKVLSAESTSAGQVPVPQVVALAKLYWELSEDQIDARAYGLVSDSTWKQWLAGMVNNFQREPFSSGWELISEDEPDRFTGLRRLKTHLAQERKNGFDVYRDCFPRRYLKGLTGQD